MRGRGIVRLGGIRRPRSADSAPSTRPSRLPGDGEPSAEAATETPPAEDDRGRAQDRRQALKRATYFILILTAAALSARAVFGVRGVLDAHRSGRELARLEGEVDTWRERNAFLEKRIAALRQDPGTLEAIARERLDWVRPGEITFLFPHDPAALERGDPGPVAPGEFSAVEPP